MTATTHSPARRATKPKASRGKTAASKPHGAKKPGTVTPTPWGAEVLKKIEAFRQALATSA